MDQWGKTKRLGHKGLEIILHHRPTWTPKLLWGIKIESYCVKHEAPLKFTLGAYSTGYSAYSLLLCCTHKDEVDKVWIFIIFHTHTHTQMVNFVVMKLSPSIKKYQWVNDTLSQLCSNFGKKIILYLMSHSKRASYTSGSTYYETLVAYFLLKNKWNL